MRILVALSLLVVVLAGCVESDPAKEPQTIPMPTWAPGDGWVTMEVSHDPASGLDHWGWKRTEIDSHPECGDDYCKWDAITFWGSQADSQGRHTAIRVEMEGAGAKHTDQEKHGATPNHLFPLHEGKSYGFISPYGDDEEMEKNATVGNWERTLGLRDEWRALPVTMESTSHGENLSIGVGGKRWLSHGGIVVREESYIRMDMGTSVVWSNSTSLLLSDSLVRMSDEAFILSALDAFNEFDIGLEETLFAMGDWSKGAIENHEGAELMAGLSEDVALAGANISLALVTGDALQIQEDIERAGSALLSFMGVVEECMGKGALFCDEDEYSAAIDEYDNLMTRAETRLDRMNR